MSKCEVGGVKYVLKAQDGCDGCAGSSNTELCISLDDCYEPVSSIWVEDETAESRDTRIAVMLAVANNAIYFDDASDFETALYRICVLAGMDQDDIGKQHIDDKESGVPA